MKSRLILCLSGILSLICLFCFGTKAQNTSLPVGTVPGSADVTAMGAATYNIPIEVVPGTHGMQPNLNVVYNSMANTGILGSQWDLGGISAITRVGQNTFLDLRFTSVAMDYSDRFALDGNRLVCYDPILYGQHGTLYQPEFEDFSKIYSYGTFGNGPESFKVYRDDGSMAEYGNSADSRQRIGNCIYSWYVNKIIDINGNYMTFTYGYNGSELWIDHIDYTGNTAAGLSPYARVSFAYDTYAHIGSTFVAGYEIPQTRLLRAITVQYKNGTDYELVRQYQFSYTEDYPKRLAKIGLMGFDGSVLNPTEVEWNTLEYGEPDTTSYPVTPNLIVDERNCHAILDFNGDGLSDMVEFNEGRRRILINQNGTFHEIDSETPDSGWYIAYLLPADIDGDGISEIVTIYKSTNSTNHTTIATLTDNSLHNSTLFNDFQTTSIDSVFSGNFCNNGKHQLLFFYDHGKILLWGQSINSELVTTNHDGRFDLLDFDGDGQTEFVYIQGTATSPCSLAVYKYNASTHLIECRKSLFPFGGSPLQFGDITGDGISDCLYRDSNSNYYFAIGNGDGFIEHIPLSCSLAHDTLVPIIADINNDGYSDVLTFKKVNSDYGRVKVLVYLSKGYYSNAIQFFHNIYWLVFHPCLLPKASQFGGHSLVNNLFIGNFNEDKRLDFLVAKQYGLNNRLTLYEFNENKTFPCVKQIMLGDGSYVQWEHHDIRGYYYQYASYINTFPYYFDVVKTMRISGDRPNRKFAYHYQFENPHYSFRRHSVMGFSQIIRMDSVLNVTDTTFFANVKSANVWQDVLMPVRKTTKMGYFTLKSDSYIPAIQYLTYNRRKPYISYCSSNDFLTNTMTIQQNTINTEGRLTGSSTATKDIDDAVFLTKDSVRYHFSTIYLPNGTFLTKMDSTVSYSYSDNSSIFFTKKQTFSYLDNGRLLSTSTLCDGVMNTVTNNIFDAFGNVKRQIISATGCENRETNRLFDATGRFCVTEFNAMNLVTSVLNDPYTGLPLSTIDQNILTTTYRYDAFGKLISIHYPDGNMDTITYAWYTDTEIPNAKYYKKTVIPGNSYPVEEYYDLLGRNICTRNNGYYSDTRYNNKGYVEKVSKPYLRNTADEDKLWHTWQYDIFGRVTRESDTYSDIEYIYQGRKTTVWDHLRNIQSSKTIDAAGRPSLISDEGGHIQYAYTPMMLDGKAVLNTNVIANGNSSIIVTDQRGNRIQIQDPDAGTSVYAYNAYGEMIKQVNAKGDTLKISYDKLGRISQKQYIDSANFSKIIQYSYDYQNNQNKGLGKLHQLTVNGVLAEQYIYDALSRIAQHTRSIDGIDYTESYAYNNYGQLATLTYPDGFSTDFTYTGKGYLEEITRHDGGQQIYKTVKYNIFGQPTKCNYGNATATEYKYNVNGQLVQIKSGLYQSDPTNPGGPPIIGFDQLSGGIGLMSIITDPYYYSMDSTIQNFHYTYDNKGRLIQRTQGNSQYETFQYDNLDRLISFTQGKVNGVSHTFTTAYDSMGNILSNTFAGTYSYDSNKPHAVTGILPSNDFPNAVAADSCETEYNVFNQPSRIREGDVEILLEYGADNQRMKAVFKRNGQVERTRYYINANYEKEVDASGVTTHYNYIYGATGLAAICVRRNSVDSMYYVYSDRLGSYTHITNANRQVIRSLHFDPWGNVKTDTNWTMFADREPGELAGTFRFDRGFTGHEHYADMNIINMNGRLYDPVIARFFSPDNFVQAPEFTQSYNRYSYCLNNPLQWVDPSGESFIADILYGICSFLTIPARITTEGVFWINDHINGNVKSDGYFHGDYIFNSAPPHYINYNNVVNLQNPYVYSFYEPDMMTDADGTTYRTEYYWTAVGAGGAYNLTFANQNFSGTVGHYHETVRWFTREVPVESNVNDVETKTYNTFNVDVGLILNFVGTTSSLYADGNSGLNYTIPYGFSSVAYGGQLLCVGNDINEHGLSFESVFDFAMANISFWGGPFGAYIAFTLDMYKRGIIWTANYCSELEMELRKMNSPQTYY